ncbi:MAG: cupin domain-containing protein [Acidimicrobiia bacterium]
MTYTLIDDLTADLDVPADGTLSRVLAKHGPVRLVAFAFDAGEELTEHTASVPVIVQMISGAVSIELSGERHLLGPRSWLYLDAGEPHSVYAEEPARMLLTMIRAS